MRNKRIIGIFRLLILFIALYIFVIKYPEKSAGIAEIPAQTPDITQISQHSVYVQKEWYPISLNFDVEHILDSDPAHILFETSDRKVLECHFSNVDLDECEETEIPLFNRTPDPGISWCYEHIPGILADALPPPGPVIDQHDSAVCGDDGKMVARVILLQDKSIWLWTD